MKNKITFLLLISLSLIFLACKKNPYDFDSENTINIEVSNGNKDDLITTPQKWEVTDKKICVVLGYDFNDDAKADDIISLLQQRYGLAEDGGLIYPLIFPDDFKASGRSYQNNLRLILQDDIPNLAGVVILGAPEKTHLGLARNQDFWNMDVPYPVIALFPQDDVLGLEATCDIVLDKGQAANFSGEVLEEESLAVAIPEAPEIITETIDYIVALDGTLPKDKSLSNHVAAMYHNHKIHHYSDPETGLQSINHFVLN